MGLKNGPDVDKPNICRQLLEGGVNINNTDMFGQTALIWGTNI